MATTVLTKVSLPSIYIGNQDESVVGSRFNASDLDGIYTEDFQRSYIEIYDVDITLTNSYVDSKTFSFNSPFAFIPYITLSNVSEMDNIVAVVKSVSTSEATITVVNADQNQDYINYVETVHCVIIGVGG